MSAANAGIKDAPSSPRSSSEGGLASRWFNVLRDSDASRTTLSLHRGDLFSARASLRSARHRAASPNIRRSMFRCSGSSHRAGWNRYPRRARSTPGSRFALCLSWNRARLPLRGLRSFVAAAAPRNKCSAAREAREKGEPARTAEGWVRYAHCRLARDRSREWRLRNGERLENENTSVPAVEIRQVQPTQARVVSVCRLRRNQAGRAARVGESWPLLPALLGTAAIAW